MSVGYGDQCVMPSCRHGALPIARFAQLPGICARESGTL
jgi:hypothetical protein